ncbi:MAG: UvrD-helicase domain-containing protein [Firmicutes bacterium]|nr:UvrD-helicase domain-containing protein [Bacillota bacterium]
MSKSTNLPDHKEAMPVLKEVRPTPEQERFVQSVHDSILLHACVGTGKTFALANRAAEAIRRGIPPERILCVTFTNRAAQEMRDRVALYCPQDSHRIVIRTFHGLCAWILRLRARQLGIPQDFSIIDEDDAQEIITHLKLPERTGMKASEIYHLLQDLKIHRHSKNGESRSYVNGKRLQEIYDHYQSELVAYRGLDFGDLIALTHQAFSPGGPLNQEWSQRFDLVQVDEMQDTHLVEYDIVAHLARRSQNLVLAGDFDQTIYEWRGSNPQKVLSQFKKDFPRYKEMTFTFNFRATRTLIAAAQAVVTSLSNIKPQPAVSSVQGQPIVVHRARTEEGEANWIASQIRILHQQGTAYDRIGVLCRSNKRAQVISRALERRRIPHLTVETYEFFRRQEVKDCLAYLRMLLNPEDSVSLRRVLRRPPRGIGERTLQRIEESAGVGLRLPDLLNPAALETGDPFAPLLMALEYGTVIVFDCETTGIDPAVDEIIEIAAYKIHRGQLVDTFHRYITPSRSVGHSVHVHGLTDEFLAEQGKAPQIVLQEFQSFIGEGLLVGHNVVFDLRMLEAACHRHGIPFQRDSWVDTLSLARRFVQSDTYKLGDLADLLGLAQRPTHRALDDVGATWELLKYIVPKTKQGAQKRREMVQAVAHAFWPLAEQISHWQGLVQKLRPHQLLTWVLSESGLLEYYKREEKRMNNIQELLKTAQELDDPKLPPATALESFTSFAALARNIDRVDRAERVTVITVHQAKGLEFDVVFMAGLSHDEFPHYLSMKEGREEEEKRLFYVGITRAKQRLFMSYHQLTDKGYSRVPSRYLDLIPNTIEARSG